MLLFIYYRMLADKTVAMYLLRTCRCRIGDAAQIHQTRDDHSGGVSAFAVVASRLGRNASARHKQDSAAVISR